MTTIKTLPDNVPAGYASPVTAGPEMNAQRTQSLLLTFFGIHLRQPGVAVSSGSVIEVLQGIGVSEEATRSTVSRMARRGLLHRVRSGRRSYLEPTERLRGVLDDGHRRVWELSPVNRSWDGSWTTVAFSLPDSWSRQRHDLRHRLGWARFGMLQPGLWVAPGRVDVPEVIAGLGLDDHLVVTHGRTLPPTRPADLVRRGFDLSALEVRYRHFVDRWGETPPAGVQGAMAQELLLHGEWLELIRRDPRLPADLLPPGWPAIEAEQVFRRLAVQYRQPSRHEASQRLDTIPGTIPSAIPGMP